MLLLTFSWKTFYNYFFIVFLNNARKSFTLFMEFLLPREFLFPPYLGGKLTDFASQDEKLPHHSPWVCFHNPTWFLFAISVYKYICRHLDTLLVTTGEVQKGKGTHRNFLRETFLETFFSTGNFAAENTYSCGLWHSVA